MRTALPAYDHQQQQRIIQYIVHFIQEHSSKVLCNAQVYWLDLKALYTVYVCDITPDKVFFTASTHFSLNLIFDGVLVNLVSFPTCAHL